MDHYFRGEYFLADYISKIGNFDFEALHSGWQTEGYFYDSHFDGGKDLKGRCVNTSSILKIFIHSNVSEN